MDRSKEQVKRTFSLKGQTVFIISAILSIGLAAWGIFGQESARAAATTAMTTIKSDFGWLYLAGMLAFVLLSLVIAISPLGRIRLGKDDEKPEVNLVSWFGMLFGAGMGIGLVFWGCAEPLSHYLSPMGGIEAQSLESEAFAVRSSFMHWGLHPWACYVVLGLGLGILMFRKGKPGMVSGLISPLCRTHNTKLHNGVKAAIDIYTTVLTTVGVATSFGLGILQICKGLEYLFNVPNTMYLVLALMVVIAFIYLKTAVSGIDKGIKLLSNINIALFTILLLAIFIIGPTGEDFRILIVGVKDYVVNFFPDSLRLAASDGSVEWIQDWRVFYWAWWLSWAPFVGFFIARISRGRTVRQFIVGTMIIPTLIGILWFTACSGLMFNVVDAFTTEQLTALLASPELTPFYIFKQYEPFGEVLSIIAMLLLGTFFITSANSATFILGMTTSNGNLNPPNSKKIFWGVLVALVALALILAGGLEMIQTISIVIAFPYLFLLFVVCVSNVVMLCKEYKVMKAGGSKEADSADGSDAFEAPETPDTGSVSDSSSAIASSNADCVTA